MAVTSCDPATLARESACYCYDSRTADAVIIYLLKRLAGNEMDRDELARAAACYCFDQKTSEAVKTMLLCEAATAAGA